ncbi:MAG: hypothetical protein ACKVZ0_20900 [Gemmatimonadales bacterium]
MAKQWLRRIRAAVGIGLAWGLAWFGAGLLLLLIVGFGAADVPFPLFFGLLGFLAGVTFAGVLGMVEGRRRFDQMSLPRFAGWGAVGGALLSVLFVSVVALAGDPALLEDLVFLGPIFAAAGAGSAAGSLALARKAQGAEPLAATAEAGATELADRQSRERLGGGG